MHDIKWIRDNPDAFDRGLQRRGLPPQARDLIAIDERRRALITKLEQAQARRNAASKEVGEAKKAKDEARAQALMAEVASLKETMPATEAEEKKASKELDDALAQIPNTPLDDVPDGPDESGNVEHHHFGTKRNYAFTPKQHFELGEALGEMDFETAAKLSGARFVVLKKGLARMERALGQFMLDLHTDTHGYTEIDPPLLVNDDAMFGTAQLPKFKSDQFSSISLNLFEPENVQEMSNVASTNAVTEFLKENYAQKWRSTETFQFFYDHGKFKKLKDELIKQNFRVRISSLESLLDRHGVFFADAATRKAEKDRRWLIPTAEVSLTNLVRESIIAEEELPLRFTACTPCFRAEAGAAGRDTRGMIRQHQFTKVELVSVTAPEKSRDEHERMLACAEEVLKRLDLHYRVVTLCTGDMGFASQKTYDIEVWLPGQGAYREISSCSVCGDFQARRMGARYRGKDGKVRGLVHTLNGSGTAVGRALVAVMETYQQENGTIAVPDALQPYMGGKKVIGEAA
ncbi:MAG: serine--tRNA ligase [Rhizobiales bacterium]|nr:serine--tRNA ligase [Hyphomicrobiales bacterium]